MIVSININIMIHKRTSNEQMVIIYIYIITTKSLG